MLIFLTLIMVKYNKCPNCKRKGLYIGDGGDVCCFCGQSVPNKMYGEMGIEYEHPPWDRKRNQPYILIEKDWNKETDGIASYWQAAGNYLREAMGMKKK